MSLLVQIKPDKPDKPIRELQLIEPHLSTNTGYSGVATFTKVKPISVTYGIGSEEHDDEGRAITCEFDDFFLVSAFG